MEEKTSGLKMSKPEGHLVLGMLVLGIIVGLALGYVFSMSTTPKEPSNQTYTNETFQVNLEKVQEQINYFEEYYTLLGQNVNFTILSAKLNSDDLIEVKLRETGSGQEVTFYFTKNYKIMPQGPVDLKEFFEEAKKQIEAERQQLTIPTADKPVVKLFVMSFCPYGNIAENNIKDVLLLLESNIDFEPVYILSGSNGNYQSLHGVNELNQDIREKIIFKEYGTKVWAEYVYSVNTQCNINNVESCWKTVADSMGLDSAKIEQRYNTEFNNIADEEAQKTFQFQVTGSPTLLINGKMYRGDRSPNSYLGGICSGFNKAPSECDRQLSTTSSAASGSC